MYRIILVLILNCLTSTSVLNAQEMGGQLSLPAAFKQLTRDTQWRQVAEIPVQFNTYHPQGFTLIDNYLFVSSVEILERTTRFPQLIDGMDRSTGTGKGHVFKLDLDGNLVGHAELGEGDLYHPGGIDYDGTYIWIPVAEYRPNSSSIIYRIAPEHLSVEQVFRVQDHIGGIVHNTNTETLHGVSWGARRFYTWTLDGTIKKPEGGPANEENFVLNPSHYIDHQDCEYVEGNLAICSGLASYYSSSSKTRLSLGGLELIDVHENRPVHQVPFPYWTESGIPMTQNPVFVEAVGQTMRLYAMPEDNQSNVYIYETSLKTSN